MRKARSIADGASSETRNPIVLLTSRLTLISPRPRLTGSINSSTWRTRGSWRNAKLTLIG